MRVLISVAASLMLMLALVGPVAATGPGCSGFGHATASLADVLHPWGRFLSGYARQGMVSGLVASEHARDCVQR